MKTISGSRCLVIFSIIYFQSSIDVANALADEAHFSNRHFNDLLLREMVEMTQSNDNFNEIRVKRNAKSEHQADADNQKCPAKQNKSPFDNCCMNNAKDMDKQRKMKALRRQCFREISGNKNTHGTLDVMSCERVAKARENFLCIAQCVGQKLNVIDANGNIMEANIIKHVEGDLPSSSWQRAIAKNVTEQCITEAKHMDKVTAGFGAASSAIAGVVNPHEGNKNSHEPKCNPAAIRFSFCLWREFMKACPKDYQSKEPQCVQLLNELNKKGGENSNENSNENSDDSYEDDE